MRVAIAHEWLVRLAGSERCVEQLLAEFPDARLLTTVVVPSRLPAVFGRAEASFLQRLPGARGHHEWFLPLMPLAWRLRAPVDGVDVVVSSNHACAKAVRIAPGIPHLCYCHAPMRYAWDFASESERFPAWSRPLARTAMVGFRRWDRGKAAKVTCFLANSSAVAGRIRRFYGRDAQVVHPPVRTHWFTPGDASARDEFFLHVSRLTGYKRARLVVEAFRGSPHRLVVVGQGEWRDAGRVAPPNVRFEGEVTDERLRHLYRSARALVYPADEDFGIVMAEAQACGTPVIGLRRGGALDIVEDGVTGWLIDDQDVDELRTAVARAASEELDAAEIRRRAERFSEARFRREIRGAVDELVAGGPG